jgi:hypothetical protein
MSDSGSAATPRRARPAARRPLRVRTLVVLTALAVGLAWWTTRSLGLKASSPSGYWLGVAGGIAMLLVFLYPMRKRIGFMRSWGAAKPWFIAHMVCGLGGPLLVLVHTGFHVGSINSAVALACMLVVAASGLVGRFVYLRIHQGLSGAHWTLAELHRRIGRSDAQMHSRLAFAPEIERRLHEYSQAQAVLPEAGAVRQIAVFLAAPVRGRIVRGRCRHDLTAALKSRAAAERWDRSQYRRAFAKTAQLVDDYLDAVQRAAQLTAYERIFSWWHVLHLPLVWLLVLSAIAHVVAVHAY